MTVLATVVAVLDLVAFGVVVGRASASRPAIRFWGAITLSLAGLDILRVLRLADLLSGSYVLVSGLLLVASHLAVLRFRSLVAKRPTAKAVALIAAAGTAGSVVALTAINLAGIATVTTWYGAAGMVALAWWCGALAEAARATWTAAGRLRSPVRARRQRVLARGLVAIVAGLALRGVGWYVQVEVMRAAGQVVTLCGVLCAVVALAPATFGARAASSDDVTVMLRMSRELVRYSTSLEELAGQALGVLIDMADARWGYVVDVDGRILATSPLAPLEPPTRPAEGHRQRGVTILPRSEGTELWLPVVRGSRVGHVVLALGDLDPLFGGEDLRQLAGAAIALGPALDRVESTTAMREQRDRNRQLVEELKHREWALAEAQHIAQLGSWTWHVGAPSVEWSQALYHLYGEDPSTFDPTHDNYRERIHPADRGISDEAVQRCLATGEPWCVRYRVAHADGGLRILESRGRLVRVEEDGEVMLAGTCRDVTAEEALVESLRALGRRVTEVQERERREIALRLHDDVGQVLTGLELQLEAHLLACSEPQMLVEARRRLRDLHNRVRSLVLDLRPTVLDDLGLGAALRWLAREAEESSGAEVDLRLHDVGQSRYPEEVEVAVYRIVQEAVTNSVRHGGADAVSVSVLTDDDVLVVEVIDDGGGFDPLDLPVRATGLSGMRERAGWLGGSLTVTSSPEGGTRVAARLPVTSDTTTIGRRRPIATIDEPDAADGDAS